ncbi:hypothetical protein BH11PLA1_BH11PLA1_01130 [soil metagenome]
MSMGNRRGGWMVTGLTLAGAVWVAAAAGARPGGLAATPAVATVRADIASPGEALARGDAWNGVMKALSVEERAYAQHVITLSNPFFEGRAPGTRGNVLAAEYVDFYLRDRLKLEPAFPRDVTLEDGTVVVTPRAAYRQPFARGKMNAVKKEAVSIRAAGTDAATLAAGRDFNTLGYSGSGTVTGPIVDCGYAIDKAKDGFTSYPEGTLDLKGKIALIFRFEPMNERGRSVLAAADAEAGTWTTAASLAQKVGGVIRRGASAVVLVNPPGADDPRVNQLDTAAATQQGLPTVNVPVIMLSQSAGERLLTMSKSSLMAARRRADEGKQVTEMPDVELQITTEVERTPVMTDNIAGILPGKGSLAEQYIIVGGHYDHVGYGYFGSRAKAPAGKIHAGADDNASGASGVLLAAQMMKERYAALPEGASARSIIFVCFSGEESGLNGAKAFIKNCPVPAAKVFAMLNMDMIGRLRAGKVDVDGVGTAEEFDGVITPIFQRDGLTPKKGQSGRGPSDHAEFFGAGIPVLHFFTGLHAEYHTPADTFETLNIPGAVQVVRTVCDVAETLAQREPALTFRATRAKSLITMPTAEQDAARAVEEKKIADEKKAHDGAAPNAPALTPQTPAANPHGDGAGDAAPAGAGPGGSRVRFGIAPGDYSGEDGVLIGDVYEGTPAAKAGLKADDMMLAWNGTPLRSVEEWMPMLARAKPGDVVKVKFTRAGKAMETTVTLTAREEERVEPK